MILRKSVCQFSDKRVPDALTLDMPGAACYTNGEVRTFDAVLTWLER